MTNNVEHLVIAKSERRLEGDDIKDVIIEMAVQLKKLGFPSAERREYIRLWQMSYQVRHGKYGMATWGYE